MKKIKELTKEEIEAMSYADVAYYVLSENGKKIQILDLFKKVIKIMELPESYIESKIGDFFGLLSTDKRFTMLEKGYWDLKENHVTKVVIMDDEEDEEEIIDEEDDEIEDDESLEDNYDDNDDIDKDDDEEDAYKDLVIIDENEEDAM